MLRFSLSPTRDMHIGDLRVAILNYLVAQQRKENFIVRIDDHLKRQNIEGKDTEMMQILEKFSLIHHSVFHQSEYLHMHQTLAIKLLEEEKAFVCTCSEETLDKEKTTVQKNNAISCYSGCCENKNKTEHAKLKASGTPFVLRLKKPINSIVYHDLRRGDISTTPNDIDAMIILDTEGIPTYDFACACDDMLSGITLLIKEEKDLLQTAKQLYIKHQLGYTEKTSHIHIPNIFAIHNHLPSIQWLFEQGFIPDAIINYVLLLGKHTRDQEIFTLPQAIEWFALETIFESPAQFDINKLKLINRKHLEMMEDKSLSSLFGFADADVGKLAKLYLEEASTINELATKIRPIFAPKVFEGKWIAEMTMLKQIITNAPMIDTFEEFVTYMVEASELKDQQLFQPLRLLLTGAKEGPELSKIYPLIKSYLFEVAS